MADSSSRVGARYATPEIIEYVNRVHASHDASLARAFTVPEGIPAIMLAPSEGKLVQLILKIAGAKHVVEVGTLIGYSAMHIARALPADGHVHTIEFDPKHAEVARGNLAAAGLASRVTVHVGAGNDLLPTLVDKGPFDAVFLDADKESYIHYARWALANLKPGGLILGDNAYLFGDLVSDTEPRAPFVRQFHEFVAEHFDSVCIPTPDGLVLGIKK